MVKSCSLDSQDILMFPAGPFMLILGCSMCEMSRLHDHSGTTGGRNGIEIELN